MNKHPVEKIRNIGIISHGGAGKTSLVESLLFTAGAVKRLGRVDEGTSIMDYDKEEIKRKITINTSLAPCQYNDCKFNLIDTPGYFDFVGELKGALRVADSSILVMCAASGVEVGTELAYDYSTEYQLPKLAFINKMDRENANFNQVLDQVKEKFDKTLVVPLTIPIGQAESFEGIVDIYNLKATSYKDLKGEEIEIPESLKEEIEMHREALIEAAAEGDDELLMKCLEGEELTKEEVLLGLKKGVKNGKVLPVLAGSAYKNMGVDILLEYAITLMPSPLERGELTAFDDGKEISIKVDKGEDFTALVFKTMADPYVGKLTFFRVYSGVLESDSQIYNASKGTTERVGQLFLMQGKDQMPVDYVQAGDIAAVAKLQETGTGDTLCKDKSEIRIEPINYPKPVISFAVEPKSKNDEEKVGMGIAKFLEEDPTITVERNKETKETILSGMGEMHLDILVNRLSSKFGVEVELKKPRIPYKETLKSKIKVEGKHKKQSGGRGQFGHVWIEFEPLTRGEQFEFVDKIFGGAVPRNYIPAVEKGLIEAMEEGVIAGYPVVDIKATLFDGSYHSVDSSEMAFKIAASQAFKEAMLKGQASILEPIMDVEVTVDEQFMGDIMGDMNSRRGKIIGMDPLSGNMQKIKAQVPLAEMYQYSIDLRSKTQGRGHFTMEYSHYEEVPPQVAQEIVKEKEGVEVAGK
ncbi:elongation factor G [Proteinivorax hydrogeniformans]|uniref:Elongation factor G n=1 Tax=Proteinivorax hydrogeniformans TaxID=1826727 RepID=A0AAU8HTV8_9FIRM